MMEIQPKAKPIYLIDLDTSAQYDRKRKSPFQNILDMLMDQRVFDFTTI